MKLNKRCGMLVAALASIGMGSAVVYAQSSETTTGTGTGTTTGSGTGATTGSGTGTGTMSQHHKAEKSGTARESGGREMGHPMLVGATLRATRQLNLTAAQKSQIKTIMENAHQQAKANMAERQADMSVLGDPSNPGYSAAIQAMKTNAANRIQQESDVQSQIVNVLTPEQKAKLPNVLASMQTRRESRRAAAAEEHSGVSR